MLTDFHMHTDFSVDGKASIEEMAEAAARTGHAAICLTDHCDLGPEGFDSWGPPDYAAMMPRVEALRARYPDMDIHVGMEAGDMIVDRERMRARIKAQPLDFVLLSTHFVDGVDIYHFDDFIQDGLENAYARYLERMLDSVTHFADFDALAHIGYCAKFAPPGTRPLLYADHPERIDAILRCLISQGKVMEINTSGIDRLGIPLPGFDIVKRYARLGGEALTFGSDAHATNRVGERHMRDVMISAKEAGIKYNVLFKERKPRYEKL